jgi:hypothetical protein
MVLDWSFYLNLAFSIGGICFFILSLRIIIKIKEMFPGSPVIKKWNTMMILIYIFLAGYVFNILFLALELTAITTVMTAIVYVFGGLFVYLIINLSYKTYKSMILKS